MRTMKTTGKETHGTVDVEFSGAAAYRETGSPVAHVRIVIVCPGCGEEITVDSDDMGMTFTYERVGAPERRERVKRPPRFLH